MAPGAVFIDNRPQILFSGGRYFLKLQSGDLRLYSDFGNGQKQYWSLKKTTIPTKDLSQVAYASKYLCKISWSYMILWMCRILTSVTAWNAGIVTGGGGIGLFKSNGALLWNSGKLRLISSNPHDTYFGVDPDGNLRTYALLKGHSWGQDFVAVLSVCNLPNSCGQYGVCSNSKCRSVTRSLSKFLLLHDYPSQQLIFKRILKFAWFSLSCFSRTRNWDFLVFILCDFLTHLQWWYSPVLISWMWIK